MKNLLKRNCDLDERQMQLQRTVLLHTTLLYMVLILVNGFLKEEGIVWSSSGLQEGLILFWLGAALALCEYILRDITPRGSTNDWLYITEGVAGAVLLALSLSDVAHGEPLAEGTALTHDGGFLVVSALMLVVFFTYLFKRLYDRRKPAEDEE